MEVKICSTCGKELPNTNEFFNIKRKNPIRLNARCKQCESVYAKKYWLKNIEKHHISSKKSYLNNKEKILNRCAIRYENNKEAINNHRKEIYQDHKDEYSARHKKYDQTKHGKIMNVLRRRKRQALFNNCIADLTCDQWKECLFYFEYKDAYTGLLMNITSLDHIIPISKQGNHTISNVLPYEKNINSSKTNKNMETWYKKQLFYSQERLYKINEWIKINNM